MKISIFDKKILKTFGIIVGFISSIVGILAVAINYDKKYSWIWFLSWGLALLIIYIILFICANRKKNSTFKINGTTINVYIGDIFQQKDGLKVIPMNEYFDTQVDDTIVAKKSLHGKYLMDVCPNIDAFNKTVKELLEKGNLVTFFPEGSEWWCYRKPRPLIDGAFKYAVMNNVPVLPVFITFKESKASKQSPTGIPKFVVNILPPICIDQSLSSHENVAMLNKKTFNAMQDCCEKFYKE